MPGRIRPFSQPAQQAVRVSVAPVYPFDIVPHRIAAQPLRRLRQRLRDSRISFFRLLRMRLPRSAQKGELLRRKLVLLKLACGARPAPRDHAVPQRFRLLARAARILFRQISSRPEQVVVQPSQGLVSPRLLRVLIPGPQAASTACKAAAHARTRCGSIAPSRARTRRKTAASTAALRHDQLHQVGRSALLRRACVRRARRSLPVQLFNPVGRAAVFSGPPHIRQCGALHLQQLNLRGPRRVRPVRQPLNLRGLFRVRPVRQPLNPRGLFRVWQRRLPARPGGGQRIFPRRVCFLLFFLFHFFLLF